MNTIQCKLCKQLPLIQNCVFCLQNPHPQAGREPQGVAVREVPQLAGNRTNNIQCSENVLSLQHKVQHMLD